MIIEDYVSFEISKLLKEKGFNEPCYTCYLNKELSHYDDLSTNFELIDDAISAPTIQMAMKWLMEVHNLFIQITVDFSDSAYPMYDVCVINLAICTSIVVNGYNRYSYKEAVEAALKYSLENLINNDNI